jgi:hypothetical protein
MSTERDTRVAGLQALGLQRAEAEQIDDCVQTVVLKLVTEGTDAIQAALPEKLRIFGLLGFAGTLTAIGITTRQGLLSLYRNSKGAPREQ